MVNKAAASYARLHRKFLQENQPNVLADLRRKGDLQKYLNEIGTQADQRYHLDPCADDEQQESARGLL